MLDNGQRSPRKLLRAVVARLLGRKPSWRRRVHRGAGKTYACFIVAAVSLALAGCNSGGGERAAGESSSGPKSVLPPVGFSATADGFTVSLAWTAPSESAKIVEYEIRRNDRPLTTAFASATSTSDDVRPGKTYRYEIRSKGVRATSDWVYDEVKVKTPPLRQARLEGDFGATENVISFSGYDTFTHNFAWHFVPKCRDGACDVIWSASNYDSRHSLLKQKGTTYTGTYHGFFNGHCGETRSISTVDFTFKVVKAKPVEGEWRATKLEGTVEQSEVAQFGCVASRGSVSVKASLRIPY